MAFRFFLANIFYIKHFGNSIAKATTSVTGVVLNSRL